MPIPIPATTTLTPSEAPKKFLHEDYTVGWIYALEKEVIPATLMLDKEHEELQNDPKDNNSYFLGRMGEHNIVAQYLELAGAMSGVGISRPERGCQAHIRAQSQDRHKTIQHDSSTH